jgi:hypothetical protein
VDVSGIAPFVFIVQTNAPVGLKGGKGIGYLDCQLYSRGLAAF